MSSPKNRKEINRQSVAIIGTGPVGRSLGWALFHAGYPISSVVGQNPVQVKSLARALHAKTSGLSVQEIPVNTRVFILAVSDDQITSVAQELAQLEFLNKYSIAFHCSGALTADIMFPLQARNVRLMSFHPMMTFPRGCRKRSFHGIYIGIEGVFPATRFGFQIARDIGAIPFTVPTNFKTTYHLSAVWASNFLVGLMAQATLLMQKVGNDPKTSWDILEPLVKGTLNNIKRLGMKKALTGPAQRGDIGTIQDHLQELETKHPELLETYRMLTETLIQQCIPSLGSDHRAVLKMLNDN